VVILHSIETAEPLALMHEFQLSGMRVGATTAVAIDQIARADATTLGFFGTGKQARCALEAIQLVRPISRVNVYSPSAAHRACPRSQPEKIEPIHVLPRLIPTVFSAPEVRTGLHFGSLQPGGTLRVLIVRK
jgi:ornithine cyclodeaminase/alanine dehydrogenase-like protein (mu-crystallin family)